MLGRERRAAARSGIVAAGIWWLFRWTHLAFNMPGCSRIGTRCHDQAERRREEHSLLLVLRQEPARGPQADRRPDRVHLRRVRRAVHRHHPQGAEDARWSRAAHGVPDPVGDQGGAGRLRDRAGAGQAGAVGGGAQPLQAAGARLEGRRGRAREVEHPADRADRLRQDAAGADAGAHAGRAVHDGRCDHADRGGLRRRGRREHHPEAAAGGRLQRRAGAARHRLHRRGRQDLAARARTRRSRATSRARACSRRC